MGTVRRGITLQQLQERLQNIPQHAKDNIKQAVQTAALLVERDAKINAPVDTGILRNSISHQISSDGMSAQVGASVDYADFQEYGTGQRGASSGVIAPREYEYGSSRGIPARPFLGPALLKNRDKIQRLIGNAIKQALQSR